jgi:ligand-binding SRPBCC domain-containing protein
MTPHRIRYSQFIPVPPEEAWDFFSDPRNLPRITPQWMSFELLSDPPERMYPGLLIEYRVRPLWGIPLRWLTEITHVVEPFLFVDEQRFGPYRLWHHQHRFRAVAGGVEMEDDVHYLLRGGPFGRVAQRYLVRPRLEEIFRFRRAAVERIFRER